MGHHRIQEEAQQAHSMEDHEDVYYKSVLCNHHTKMQNLNTNAIGYITALLTTSMV